MSLQAPWLKRWTACIAACWFAAFAAYAQPELQVDADYATFAGDEEASLLEVYLAFEAAELQYEADSTAYRAQVHATLTLHDAAGEAVVEEPAQVSFVAPDPGTLEAGQHFVYVMRTTAPPGVYDAQVQITNGEAREVVTLPVEVRDFGAREVAVSDITLATAIQASQEDTGVFAKHGLIIRPNPRLLFGAGLTELHYYAEAYHLDRLGGEACTIRASVTESGRTQSTAGLVRETEYESTSTEQLSGAFDLSEVPNGSYVLRLAVLSADSVVAEQIRKFFVYNPGVERTPVAAAADRSLEARRYEEMNDAAVARELEQIRVIATRREWRRARSLDDPQAQRRFLMEFWDARDPDPSTDFNEFKDEYLRRLQFAEERYGDGLQEGWETDRGRVLLKYGTPSNIESNHYEAGHYPHEIWHYNYIPGEGQGMFIFRDRDGFGAFTLIHSNVPGEPKSQNWQQEVMR